jgi:hypothetical protein
MTRLDTIAMASRLQMLHSDLKRNLDSSESAAAEYSNDRVSAANFELGWLKGSIKSALADLETLQEMLQEGHLSR